MFRAAPVGLSVVRVVGCGLGAMALVAFVALARGVGFGWRSIALLVPVLALDAVFVRGALMGRPDVLTLGLVLAVVWMTMKAGRSAGGWRSAWDGALGLAAAGACLAHPVGLVAPVVALVGWLARPRPRGVRSLGIMAVAAASTLAPVLAWALADTAACGAQLVAQLTRKAGRDPFGILLRGFTNLLDQSPLPHGTVLALGAMGLAGLAVHAWRQRGFVPLVAQLLLGILVLWSMEIWYPVFLVPLAVLGAGLLWRELPRAHLAGRAGRWGVAALLAGAVLGNGAFLAGEALEARAREAREGSYQAWCDDLAAQLPVGSTVLLAAVPDPWLGLQRHPGLALREFSPIPLAAETWERLQGEVDFVVLGARCPSREVHAWVEAQGTLRARIGTEGGLLRASVFAMRPAEGIRSPAEPPTPPR